MPPIQMCIRDSGKIDCTAHASLVRADRHEMILVDVETLFIFKKSLDELVGWLYSLKSVKRSCVLYTGIMCIKGNDILNTHIDQDVYKRQHLRPRTNTFQAVFRVRSLCAYAIHKFFQERGFVYVHTPLITGSDCEGAGEMFQVTTLDPANMPMTEDGKVDYSQDFFGKETNLTVSGQLNGETFAQAFRNIYTFGPT